MGVDMSKNLKLSTIDIANYLLVLVDRKSGDAITHLKLQKLLYFAQGISLALRGIRLFEKPLKAWEHGPVSSSVYSCYKVFEKNAIPPPPEMDFDIYDKDTKYLLYKVYKEYGEHSASYLRNISHDHKSWKNAFYNSEDKTINYSDITKDFVQNSLINDLKLSEADVRAINDIEDEWWMNYDCGEPSEDVTERLINDIRLLKKDKKAFFSSCIEIEGF